MKKITLISFCLAAFAFASCAGGGCPATGIIPAPQQVTWGEGAFRMPAKLFYTTDLDGQDKADLAAWMQRAADGFFPASFAEASDGDMPALELLRTGDGAPESYRLDVSRTKITLTAPDAAGLFYGLQSLAQLAGHHGRRIPAVTIVDAPRFGYRGFMLDVSRHFRDKEFVERQLDLMARYKLNRFHWHLTDGAGWRIEIKKYPALTDIAAWRPYPDWEGWNFGGKRYCHRDDPAAAGGYYTQDDIREVVEYARALHIEVIPEIEMPGHSEEVLAVYPELSCSGKPYTNSDFCIGNEQTFEFLESVLSEVIGLFPSEYIHIGGDECPKVRWEKCPRCQARIRQLGLRDKDGYTAEHYLQGYVTDRIGKYLAERGRRIIGWDEILEGQAPSDAIVMSWRGSAGGIKAAKLGHDVIMTPNSHFYFDYYQSPDADAEPFGIGGCVTIDKVYSFDPMAGLTPEQQAHILGVQANLWTEYIASDDHLEYMLLPRLAALSEVQWCQPGVKDWVRFRDGFRMDRIYSQMGYAFAKHIFGIKGSYAVDPQKGAVVMTLTTQGDAPIHYTLDGSEPTAASPRYTGPVEIGKSARFRATALREGGENASYSREFAFSKSTGRPAVLNTKPNDSYTFEGTSLLVDGYHSRPVFTSGAWLGYLDEPLDVTIDMGGEQSYRSVELETLAEKGDWIFPPSSVTVWVSDNGTDFTEVASVTVPEAKAGDADGIGRYRMQFPETSARYLKVVAQNAAAIPAWHPGAGSKGFLFVDEVVVE